MTSLCAGDLTVHFDRDGDRNFNKAGTIDWVGKPVQISRDSHAFHFDLEGRVQRIDGFPSPHSWDWIQRTMADDWVYYDKVWKPGSLPEPSGIIGDWAWAVNGRTDLPMLLGHGGVERDYVRKALAIYDELMEAIRETVAVRPEARYTSQTTASESDRQRVWSFLEKAVKHDRTGLREVAMRLHEVHGRMAVLPPDTIGVDYRVILIKLMDGCPNSCGFCVARGPSAFAVRGAEDVDSQITALANIYGEDLYNYNSVVFGECDALVSPFVEHAARKAFAAFRSGASYHMGSHLFMFTTNTTLLEQPDSTFDMLESLPFGDICINVGWEAATDAALSRLRKQSSAQEVSQGMAKAGTLNRSRKKLRITGNFVSADGYDCNEIVQAIHESQYSGQLYLSPLHGKCSSEQALKDLRTLQSASRDVRVHLYTMQRM